MKTRTFQLNKLVRDRIVEFNLARGGKVEYTVLEGGTFTKALVAKLVEEAKELQGSQVSVEELADLQEIINQIRENLGVTEEDLQAVQDKKRLKNGGFKKGHFIQKLTLPANNEWVKYYASDPTRFPELET